MMNETFFLMMGIESQKCPAALIYNMMIFEMIDGDRLAHREVFYSGDPCHPPERGNGGWAPYTLDSALTISRYLNLYYSHLFNHWYSYDLNYTDESELNIFDNLMNPNSDYNKGLGNVCRIGEWMQRELDLVNRWVNFKKEKDRKSRYLRTVQDLWNYILIKTIDFYDLLNYQVVPKVPKNNTK